MRIAVIGGTGNLGAPLVERLLTEGDRVTVLSRGSRPVPPGAEGVEVDLHDGENLPAALAGAEVVVDAANTGRQPKRTLVDGTSRALEAAREAGAEHYLAVSVVGCDRVPLDYYRQKVAQEELIASGPLPWTLIRATQFHPFVAGIFAAAAGYGARLTGRAKLQPIEAEAVAARLAGAAHEEPGGRLPDICGPEVETLSELSLAWKRTIGSRAMPVRVPSIGGLGRSLAGGALCDADGVKLGRRFEEWLADD
jgi:uncharacterized protein YbjT (DUF2867 family)